MKCDKGKHHINFFRMIEKSYKKVALRISLCHLCYSYLDFEKANCDATTARKLLVLPSALVSASSQLVSTIVLTSLLLLTDKIIILQKLFHGGQETCLQRRVESFLFYIILLVLGCWQHYYFSHIIALMPLSVYNLSSSQWKIIIIILLWQGIKSSSDFSLF